MLRKHTAKLGMQWDKYLSGVLWAYRNTPHSTTGEKRSFLLFGFECCSPTEAALLPPKSLTATNTNVTDYQEQLMLSLLSARNLAIKTSKESQQRYKFQYDKTAKHLSLELAIGYWYISLKMKLVKPENCHNLGMGHI